MSLPAIGSLVGGKYRIERYLAEGGMGVIAVARHIDLDEPVALKILKPEVVAADETGAFAARFIREARATIKIRSEHVPRILDVATLESGTPYIAMELLIGEDLDQLLETQGPLPVGLSVDYILQALEALAAAHALGMVHRDLKPANLFVGKRLDGTTCIKVLDFGIAKLSDQNATGIDQKLTGTSMVMGSPRYMAPEQMRSVHDVDERADIWAVGITLYELLTGDAPFKGESLTAVCASILEDLPWRISERRADVPPGLDDVVLRCLGKRPTDRWSTVGELALALAPFASAPGASGLAASIARVCGSPPERLGSITSSSKLPSAPSSSPALRTMKPSALTTTAWTGTDAPATPRRRSTWPIVAITMLLGSAVIAGGALTFARFRSPPPITAHPLAFEPPVDATSTSPSPPSPSVLPSPSVSPLPSLSLSPPPAPVAEATEKARPRPHAKPPGAGKPAASSPPPVQSLWDDRK